MKLKIVKEIDRDMLMLELEQAGITDIFLREPIMLTRIVEGKEMPPEAMDGEVVFEGDEKLVQEIIDTHDPKKKEKESQAILEYSIEAKVLSLLEKKEVVDLISDKLKAKEEAVKK